MRAYNIQHRNHHPLNTRLARLKGLFLSFIKLDQQSINIGPKSIQTYSWALLELFCVVLGGRGSQGR